MKASELFATGVMLAATAVGLSYLIARGDGTGPAVRRVSGVAIDGTVTHECAPVTSGDLSRTDLPPGEAGAPDGQHLGCLLGVLRNGESEVTSILCPAGELEAACRDLEGGAVVQIDASPVPPSGRFWLPTSVVRVRGRAERSGAVRRSAPEHKREPERAFFAGVKPS